MSQGGNESQEGAHILAEPTRPIGAKATKRSRGKSVRQESVGASMSVETAYEEFQSS